MKNTQILIFTDLDGSLLNHNNFEFREIKNFILNCIKNGIKIIPNTSKTKSEIEVFLDQLGQNLPFVVENGAAIHNLDLVHRKLRFKNNSLVFSRSVNEILELFEKRIPVELKKRCSFLKDMSSIEQMKIHGLNKKYLPFALNREYSMPLVFDGSKELVNKFTVLLEKIGMKLHEGGRIYNICDDCSKGKAMTTLIEKLKNDFNFKSYTIVIGDSPNDISMLNVSDQPCIIPLPNRNNLCHLKDQNIIRATQSAPQGWEEVVRASLKKINFELEG